MPRPFRNSSLLAVATLCLPAATLAAPEGWAPLLEPVQLASILERDDGVRVIHVTGDFAAGHIPGAAAAPYPQWRGPAENPGALLPVEEFGALLRGLGIEAETPVAVIHSGQNAADMGAAARVYWTLRSLGVADVALLNGGFAAWQQAGLPVSTRPAEIAPSAFEPQWNDAWRVSTAQIAALVDSGEARLIDARPEGFFRGLTWSIARPGTIRGADSLNYEQFFDGTRMLGAERVADIAASHAAAEGTTLTVSFCNTGHWAAINWFAMSEIAGVPDTRLYAESMAEWTAAGGALDNAPNRVAIYWTQTRNWFEGMF